MAWYLMNEIWAYLIAGVLGGSSISALFRFLTTRRFQSISLEEKLRSEMMKMNSDLKMEIRGLKTELDHWKDKYHTLEREYTSLKSRFEKLIKENKNG